MSWNLDPTVFTHWLSTARSVNGLSTPVQQQPVAQGPATAVTIPDAYQPAAQSQATAVAPPFAGLSSDVFDQANVQNAVQQLYDLEVDTSNFDVLNLGGQNSQQAIDAFNTNRTAAETHLQALAASTTNPSYRAAISAAITGLQALSPGDVRGLGQVAEGLLNCLRVATGAPPLSATPQPPVGLSATPVPPSQQAQTILEDLLSSSALDNANQPQFAASVADAVQKLQTLASTQSDPTVGAQIQRAIQELRNLPPLTDVFSVVPISSALVNADVHFNDPVVSPPTLTGIAAWSVWGGSQIKG